MAIDMKDTIANTLAEITASKNVEKVTVTELVEACGISRQAFYYHFRDIMDVIVWLSDKTIHQTLEKCLAAPTLEESVGFLVAFFSDYRELNRKRLESSLYRQFESIINQHVREFLTGIAQRSEKPLSYSDFESVLDFYTGGMSYMLLTYAGKNDETDKRLVQKLTRLISGELALM